MQCNRTKCFPRSLINMQQNIKEILQKKLIGRNDDVLTRVLRTTYFNVVKHTITANNLNISETCNFFKSTTL